MKTAAIFVVTTMRTTCLAQLNILLQRQKEGKSMRIKPTNVHENMWIYYILINVNLLHVLVTFCGNLQGGVFMKDTLQCSLQTKHHCSTWMVIWHTQHITKSYSRKFSTNNFICILYILTYIVNHIFKVNILHLYIGSVGTTVAQLVEALRYKSEGRGFDSRWCHWNFSLT